MARTKFSELRDAVVAKPGATERLAELRAETMEEIRLYELRHGEAISQVELAGRLDVTQGAISKLENSEDVRVSTLRQYLEGLVRGLSSWLFSKTRVAAYQCTWVADRRPEKTSPQEDHMYTYENRIENIEVVLKG